MIPWNEKLMLFPLIKHPDPVLQTPAQTIAKEEFSNIPKLAQDMKETMYHERGVGLAAQQIGKTMRICVIDTDGTFRVLINPEIVARSKNTYVDDEGCLSVPKKFFPLERHWQVTVKYLDEYAQERKLKASGLLARAVQHELDHLNGIIVLDRYHEA